MKPKYAGKHEIKINHGLNEKVTFFHNNRTRYRQKEGIVEEIWITQNAVTYVINCFNIYNTNPREHDLYFVRDSKVISEKHKTIFRVEHPIGEKVKFKSANKTKIGKVEELQFWTLCKCSWSMIRVSKKFAVACKDDELESRCKFD